jgi:hypothetical protein
MTSLRQFEANRRNASRSTGPNAHEGKLRSRRNAVRHGLCAETVVETIEDTDDYRGFEAAIIADYDARTAVERELVLRLASQLWRLRRTTAIETDLLRIQAEILRDRRLGRCAERLSDPPFPILRLALQYQRNRERQWASAGYEQQVLCSAPSTSADQLRTTIDPLFPAARQSR